MKNKKLLETREQKLLGILEDMNGERAVGADEKLICETPINMARIRAYSDFMYLLKQRPLQIACYYGAGFVFLTMAAAIWTKEWLLTAIFGVMFFILATLPHNMRIHWFNKSADALEGYYGKNLNVEFADDRLIIRDAPVPAYKERTLEDDEPVSSDKPAQSVRPAAETTSDILDKGVITSLDNGIAADGAERSSEETVSEKAPQLPAEPPREPELIAEFPYSTLTAVECTHSFYIFPPKSEAVICDKTLFLRGTPMGARDFLARKLGKKFKIKTKVK